MPPSFRASSRSKRAARSFSRTRGTISLSTNSRAVSWIRRCSSLRSRSTRGRLCRQGLFPRAPEGLLRLEGAGTRGVQLLAVDRRHGLDLPNRRGEERLGGREQVVQPKLALLDLECAHYLRAGDRLEDSRADGRSAKAAVL